MARNVAKYFFGIDEILDLGKVQVIFLRKTSKIVRDLRH